MSLRLTRPYGTYWTTMDAERWNSFHYNQGAIHEDFDKWYKANAPTFDTVLEVGCGHGEQARITFGGHKYLGIDIGNGIEIAQNHKKKDPLHEFIQIDVMTAKLTKHDLVFAINVIDHVESPNAFIDRLISLANKQVVIHSYNGYDKASDNHTIKVNGTGDCYLNKLSVKELTRTYPQAEIKRLVSSTIVRITI